MNAPTVNNVIRLEAEVDRIEGLVTVLAGEGGAEAEPGDWASFSLAVGNDGNGPTRYIWYHVQLKTSWPVNIWDSQSSELLTDPIGRLLYTTLPIKIRFLNYLMASPLQAVLRMSHVLLNQSMILL